VTALVPLNKAAIVIALINTFESFKYPDKIDPLAKIRYARSLLVVNERLKLIFIYSPPIL
jgi:hypothetical protein